MENIIDCLEMLERKTSHIRDPDIKIPGDFEGLGNALMALVIVGFGVLVFSGVFIASATAITYGKKWWNGDKSVNGI